MAARKRLTHTEKTRDKIQTSMLVQRLENFIQTDQSKEIPDGVDQRTTKDIKMTPAQVTATLGLLKKTLPDLQAIEHGGGIDVNSWHNLLKDD